MEQWVEGLRLDNLISVILWEK